MVLWRTLKIPQKLSLNRESSELNEFDITFWEAFSSSMSIRKQSAVQIVQKSNVKYFYLICSFNYQPKIRCVVTRGGESCPLIKSSSSKKLRKCRSSARSLTPKVQKRPSFGYLYDSNHRKSFKQFFRSRNLATFSWEICLPSPSYVIRFVTPVRKGAKRTHEVRRKELINLWLFLHYFELPVQWCLRLTVC